MISIVIPVYAPSIEDIRNSVESALKTNTNEIIIVDDCTDKIEYKEYFDFLNSIKDERVKIIYNEVNKGRFANSLFAVQQATNKYVKKLDCDDEIVTKGFNEVNSSETNSDILFTRYSYKGKVKNKGKTLKWNIFNGSTIYKTETLKNIDVTNTPRNFFGDIVFAMHVLSKENVTVEYIKSNVYNYKIIGSTTPKKLLARWEDWLLGYNWVKDNSIISDYTQFTIEKQDIFYELMMIKLGKKYKKMKYRYFKSLNYTPKFIKRIITHFTFKV